MKHALTVSLITLFACTASAQVFISPSTLSPTQVNKNIIMPSGNVMVVNGRNATACDNPQTVYMSSNTTRLNCNTAASDAAAFANLAPAAGGPRVLTERNLTSDTLSGDSSLGLRNDHAVIQ